MDVEQPLMSGAISALVDREGVPGDRWPAVSVLSGTEQLMSVAESRPPAPPARPSQSPTPADGEAPLRTYVSVATVSVASVSVTATRRATTCETDPDDSADNLDYSPKHRGGKPTSGFSGDDEESCGEDEPLWSPPPAKGDDGVPEEKRPLLGGDLEVQAEVHRDSIDECSSPENRERLNVSRNSDDSCTEPSEDSAHCPPPGDAGDKEDQPQVVVTNHIRIPWTTRLIEKLTEEENRKKKRAEEGLKEVRKVRVPPKRSAIYVRTDKSSPWLVRPGKVISKNPPPVPERASLVNRQEKEKNGPDTNGGKPETEGEVDSKREEGGDTKKEVNGEGGVTSKGSRDRYAEIIGKLAVEEDDRLTDVSEESDSKVAGVSSQPSQSDTYRPESVLSYADRIDELPSLKADAKSSSRSDSSAEASPSRRPYIETAFLSNSPPRYQETEEDVMFRKLVAGPRRHKPAEEAKPKISPKPEGKTSLPIIKRVIGASTTKKPPAPQKHCNGVEELSPIYANEVFFRKKWQPSSGEDRGSGVHDETPPGGEARVNGRGVGYRVSPTPRGPDHLPRGKPVALAQIDTGSVEHRAKATRLEANHVAREEGGGDPRKDEPDFAHRTNSKFNEYVKDYKDFHPTNRSSSSSTSTIVSEAPWSPEPGDLQTAAISGSPEIRHLQMMQRRPDIEALQNGGVRVVYHSEEQRLRSQVPLLIDTGRSGRLSAPPIPYHEYSRRLDTPEPVQVGPPLHSSPKQQAQQGRPMPQQRSAPIPAQPKSVKYYSLDSEGATHLLVPVGAKVKITSPANEVRRGMAVTAPSPRPAERSPGQDVLLYERVHKTQSLPPQQRAPQRDKRPPEEVYMEHVQKTRSLPAQQRAAGLQSADQLNRSFSPTTNYRKLSRQEVEQLYWQTQQMRELHAAQLSPRSAHLYLSQYPSTGSLRSTASLPAGPQSSPAPRSVPLLKGKPVLVTNLNPVSSVPNLHRGSPQLLYYQDPRDGVLKPQAIYNAQTGRPMYLQNLQPQPREERRVRSRSVSPGPNHRYPAQVLVQAPSPQPGGTFVRGSPQRNTIGAIRTGQQHPQSLQATTIYENTTGVYGNGVTLRHPEKLLQQQQPPAGKTATGKKMKDEGAKKKDKKGKDKEKEKEYPPIFKRGSLSVSTSSVEETESPTAPKRVSFSSGRDAEQLCWPTRNGLAPEPPTRQHKQRPDSSGDSDSVFLPDPRLQEAVYMNVQHPAPATLGNIYGSISRPGGGGGEPAVLRASAAAPPSRRLPGPANRRQPMSESESGSEAGEVQRILQQGNRPAVTYYRFLEEEWAADGKPRGPPGSDQSGSSGGGRDDEVRRSAGARGSRRDEPRRHTLSGDHHHQGGSLARSMDLEMSSKQRRKSPLPRGYPPPSSAMLFDDDPGIMSEVETSSTGFRRGGKQRSSLPVVRTPSKTLERPLGLVFLQYRNETKRALLPNEITSLDTVRALFVRSFPKQLTMEYLDSHHVKIYIHDSSKDMFYELEDLRSHLRDIRDRSVLRLFESADVNGGVLPGAGVGVAPPLWDQDQSYFSEPEFDSEYQHQHIHKSKTSSKSSGGQPYYMTHSYPPGGAGSSATLPRGGSLLRTYSPAVPPPLPADRIKSLPQTGVGPPPKPVRTYHQAQGLVARGNQPIYGSFVNCADRRDQSSLYASPDRLHAESGYMSSPERGGPRGSYPPGYLAGGGPGSYEDPYYSQYAPRSGSITPVIDEEASDTELLDESYSLYGVKLPSGRPVVVPPSRGPFPASAVVPYDQTRASLSRIRVEHMERQLANLTGLVQKALTHTPTPREYLQVPVPSSRDASNYRNAADDYDKHSSSSSASLPDEAYLRTDTKPPKLGKDKSVSFEKSVSFSDEPPDMNSPKQHSPQHAERNDRDRHKPAPPPKPVSLSPAQYEGRHIYRDLQMTPELYNQLRGLQKKAKDLRTEVRNLRRMSQAQAHSVRETIRDTFIKIRAVLVAGGADVWSTSGDHDKLRLTREEDLYKQEMLRLETDLTELESTVEELRGNVINRKTRVNMSDVENMALILSKSSKTVADLKVRFPGLQEGMKSLISSEMEKVVREEKFLNEEPERLESALRRCKKLTGTLVTLKRLASVQEQRLPPSSTPESRLSPTMGDSDSTPPITPPAHGKAGAVSTRGVVATTLSADSLSRQRPENALDALLDELQTFARPPSNPSLADIGRKGSVDSQHPPVGSGGTLRRLHSYPSSSDGGGSSPPTLSRLQAGAGVSPKPPVPERNAELLAQLAGRRQPPPPPPRTSSRSPLASPTSPSLPPRGPAGQPQMGVSGTLRRGAPGRSSLREPLRAGPLSEARPTEETNPGFNPLSASNSSSCESVNSQEGLQPKSGKQRQEVLEQRHQELLRKQKALQEQYARLQQLQRGAGSLSVPQPELLLKKTGSESNLLAKMGLGHNLSAAAPISGSLTHLAVAPSQPIASLPPLASMKLQTAPTSTTTTNKIYETDIL